MEQEDDPEQFQERLNQMKAINFREERDDKLKMSIFYVLQQKINKSRRKHSLSLYCKVFKGLMTHALQLNDFYARLSHFYMRILLQQHFAAMKQFVTLREKQRTEKQYLVSNMRKKRELRILCKRHRQIKDRKVRQIQQESPKNQAQFKTQDHFYQNKPFNRPIEPLFIKTANLQDSRKSSHSLYGSLDKPSRRKFVPIKQVPQLPVLLSVQQQKMEVKLNKINQEGHFKDKPNDTQSNQQSQKNKPAPSDKSAEKTSIKAPIQDQPQQQIKAKPKKWEKDKILALLSEISITSWLQMNDIIQDHANSTLKSESLLSEKANLTRSRLTIERIASLR